MGICQSTALRVIVYDFDGNKTVHNFSMKKMRTFRSIGDVLNSTSVNLQPQDRIYIQSHVGVAELSTASTFQIHNLVIKNQKLLKYRVVMEPMY